jgi:hypothetical protein
MSTRLSLLGLGLALVATGPACNSPVQDDLIASLGEEVPGLDEGVYHRYGQPCLACHGGPNSDAPQFWTAGTVFATPHDDIPAPFATVRVTDARGQVFETSTNCAGNFFFPKEQLETSAVASIPSMVFPLHAEVICTLPTADKSPGTETRRNVMGTRINREGSCNTCHDNEAPSQLGPGRIYCVEAQPEVPYQIESTCPGGPK